MQIHVLAQYKYLIFLGFSSKLELIPLLIIHF